MEEKEQLAKLEQNQQEQPMSHAVRAISTGFFGGIFWSLIGYIAHILNFTELGPALVLYPWAVGEWKTGILGQIVGIFAIGLMSIGVALLYYGVLRKKENMWIGIIFGAALWALVFYGLNPFFDDMKQVADLEMNTIVTTVCLYILYGVFIGYSISFDNVEMNKQKPSYSNE